MNGVIRKNYDRETIFIDDGTGFKPKYSTTDEFLKFLARTGNRAAQHHFSGRLFWDPTANGGSGAEVKMSWTADAEI